MRSRPSALETLNEPLVSLGVRFTSRLWAFLFWLAALLMPFPPVLGIMAGAVQKNRRPSPLGNVPGAFTIDSGGSRIATSNGDGGTNDGGTRLA